MALKPLIELTALADDAKSFLLKDVTGAYSVDNPGGYGTPNPARAAVGALIIQLFNEGNETEVLKYQPLNVTDFTDGTTAQPITPVEFGESASSYFTDGVMWVEYHALLASIALSSVTAGGLSINSAAAFTGSEDSIAFAGAIYKVDKTKTNTTSILYLETAIVETATAILPGYMGRSTLLNVKGLESDLAKAIAKSAGACGCSDVEAMFLLKILKDKVGAEVRYACGDYVGAQQIITTNKNKLEKGYCGC